MEQTALAAAATLVAVAFALSTWERWAARRRRHDLAWSAALTLFAMASASLWAGAALGWREPTFRAFYLLGGIVNVPFLAVGTVYLLAGRRAGDRAAAGVLLGSAFAVGVVTVAPLTGPVDPAELPRGSEVFGALPRVLAATASGGGALVVFAGAVASAVGLRRHGRRPGAAGGAGGVPPGRLAGGNALIAGGVLVLSVSGLVNSVLGEMEAFSVTLAVGAAALFGGFLVATTPGRSSRPVSEASGAAPCRRDREAARPRT